jgi:hypothetical protein
MQHSEETMAFFREECEDMGGKLDKEAQLREVRFNIAFNTFRAMTRTSQSPLKLSNRKRNSASRSARIPGRTKKAKSSSR